LSLLAAGIAATLAAVPFIAAAAVLGIPGYSPLGGFLWNLGPNICVATFGAVYLWASRKLRNSAFVIRDYNLAIILSIFLTLTAVTLNLVATTSLMWNSMMFHIPPFDNPSKLKELIELALRVNISDQSLVIVIANENSIIFLWSVLVGIVIQISARLRPGFILKFVPTFILVRLLIRTVGLIFNIVMGYDTISSFYSYYVLKWGFLAVFDDLTLSAFVGLLAGFCSAWAISRAYVGRPRS
jgi:hypothetical protein